MSKSKPLGPREMQRIAGKDGATAPRFAFDAVPLYYQLGSVLREQITSGRFTPGDRNPTEAELAGEYGVSRITVRQALAALEAEGLISRTAGRGTFVSEPRVFKGAMKFEGSLEDLITMAVETSVKLLELQTVEATAQQAGLLRVAEKSRLTRCTRLRFHNDAPLSYVLNLLPYEVGRHLRRADWKKGSVLRALQRLGYELKDAEQSVRASLADANLARLLQVRIGAPLLSVDRIVYTAGGHPMEYTHTYYRSDIYSLSIHLTHTHTASSLDAQWSLRHSGRK
jgi:GntR family transcriptional regulator